MMDKFRNAKVHENFAAELEHYCADDAKCMAIARELRVMAAYSRLLHGAKVTGIVAFYAPHPPCRDWASAQTTHEQLINDLSDWRIVGVAVA